MKTFALSVLVLLTAFSSASADDLIGLIRHDSEIIGWIELQEESLEALALLSEVGVLPEGGTLEYVERSDYQTRDPDLLSSVSLTVGTADSQGKKRVVLGDIAGGQLAIESSNGQDELKFQRYAITCF